MKWNQSFWRRLFLLFAVILLSSVLGLAEAASLQEKGYVPEEIVILSRHNLRAPMKTETQQLKNATSHAWMKPDVPDGELSYKGGVLETMMGQYFGACAEKEKLIFHLEKPEAPSVYFLAGSSERTVATARYFAAGMFPAFDTAINQTAPLNQKDPVFTTVLTFMNEPYREAALAEMGKRNDLPALQEELWPGLKEVNRLLDRPLFKRSGSLLENVALREGAKPKMQGTLAQAHSLADYLLLQYYESPDPKKASFGHGMTEDDWKRIASLKDAYNEILYMSPLVAINAAHPVLMTVHDEINAPGRKFSFLCSHDSNMSAFLAALSVRPFTLPHSLERRIPFGAQIVFEKWKSPEGEEYIDLSMVYPSTEEIRERTKLTLDTPPMREKLYLEGLTPNEDGLYTLEEVNDRFTERIAAYDEWKIKIMNE